MWWSRVSLTVHIREERDHRFIGTQYVTRRMEETLLMRESPRPGEFINWKGSRFYVKDVEWKTKKDKCDVELLVVEKFTNQ